MHHMYLENGIIKICDLQLTVETDRTVVALYKFIKKHASIPFKLQKPASTPASEETKGTTTTDAKDEL